jgi:predicted phage-related endonuclease
MSSNYLDDDLDGDIYGDNDNEELSGLTIMGSEEFGKEYGGLSPEESLLEEYGTLSNMENAFHDLREEVVGRVNQEQEGMMTARDLQLGRLSHMSPTIQSGIRGLLSGKFKPKGVDPLKIAAAIEEFEDVTGMKGADFAREMKGEDFPRGIQFPRDKTEINTVISMLGNTSGEYMDKGAGSRLAGHTLNPERQFQADEDLKLALTNVKDLAALYVHEETIGSSIHGTRQLGLEEAITERFMDSTMSAHSSALLPLPNETGITGIKPTMAGKGSTALDRLQFGFSEVALTNENLPLDERSKEYWDEKPSLTKSLFPIGKSPYGFGTPENAEWFAKAKAEQTRKMSLYQEKAEFAAKVLREQMPTLRDETEGRGRSRGFDANQEEQRNLDNARNESAILDLNLDGSEATPMTQEAIAKHGKGSQKGGMYGAKELSESQVFVEKFLENESLESQQSSKLKSLLELSGSRELTDQEKYQLRVLQEPMPEQGTPEWLAQRKGNITGSIAKTLTMGRGSERMAVELARERLGTGEPFRGNAFTREGNESEDKAVASFLAGEGKNLNFEEAFFESKHKGFGASPDGRLFDKVTGESAGLLEIKNFNSKGMKTALADTQVQMQMQMMETGEKQTHFYALNKYTGESFYELVEENPELQAEILAAGQEAQEIAAGLDNRGVFALAEDVKGARKPRKKNQRKGQTEAFKEVVDKDEPMKAFNPSGGKGGESNANKSPYSRSTEEVSNAKPDGKVEDVKVNNTKADYFHGGGRKGSSGRILNHIPKDGWKVPPPSKGGNNEDLEEASESLKNFSENVKSASSTLQKLAKATMATVNEEMDAIQLGAKAGIEANQARGLSDALMESGLDKSGATSTILAAGSQVSVYKNEITAAKETARVQTAIAASSSDNVRAIDLTGFYDNRNTMDAQSYIAQAQDAMKGLNPRDRAQVANILNVPELTVSDATGETLSSASGDVNEPIMRKVDSAVKDLMHDFRDVKADVVEGIGGVVGGENLGATVAAVDIAAPAIGVGAAYLAGKKASPMLSNLKANASKAGSGLVTAAKSSASMGKGLLNAAKVMSPAIAATAVTAGARYIGDVEDDGGFVDSALDVAEFAAGGAAIGSVVPVVGTAVGAGIGAGVGVLNELYEWATSPDDAIPPTDIGQMKASTIDKAEANKTTNVDVNVEVNPDLIRTEVDVDGDLNIDEETGIGTGG